MPGLVDSPGRSATRPAYDGTKTAAGLLLVSAATLACTAPEPDPAAARLAALTAAATADSIDDLRAVDDPDAAGVRDAFRNATREALAAARQARDTAPAATAPAFARSLDAAEVAGRLGDALALALKARDEHAAARDRSSQLTMALTDAIASAAISRDLRALEAAEAALAQAGSRYDDAWGLSENPASKRENGARADRDQASAGWSAALDLRNGLVRRLRATAAGSANRRPTLQEIKERFGKEPPTPQEVERLEAQASSLTDPTVEAAVAEAEAADRAQEAMKAAEARADEAIIAYRAAVDAWRALLE